MQYALNENFGNKRTHAPNEPETANNWRVVSEWMNEDDAQETIQWLDQTRDDFRLEERD